MYKKCRITYVFVTRAYKDLGLCVCKLDI